MIKEILYCDICANEIGIASEVKQDRAMFYFQPDGYQRWPIKDVIYSICSDCCRVIGLASSLGLISYDEVLLLENTGFVKTSDGLYRFAGKDNIKCDDTGLSMVISGSDGEIGFRYSCTKCHRMFVSFDDYLLAHPEHPNNA